MKYGFSVPTFGAYDERSIPAIAREAEEAGWDGFFIWDHVLWDPFETGLADATVVLTGIALATGRIRFGALVTPLARRRPWKFARETVSLDRLSGGRLVVGVGGGDDHDFVPVGEPGDPRERASRLDEGLDVLVRLWSAEPVSYSGRHYTLRDAVVRPGPVQRPRPPIWVGGWWPNRAPFRRAARWDGAAPLNRDAPDRALPPDAVARCAEFVRGERSGGAFDVVVSSFGRPPDEYAAAGATWWLDGADPWGESFDEARARLRAGPPR